MLSFLKYKNKSDRAFLLLMILALCEKTIFVFPVVFIGRLPGIGEIAPLIFPITYTILALISLSKERTRNIRPLDFFIVFFFYMFYIISIFRNPACEKYILEAWSVDIFPAIPFFFLGLCYRPDKISMECIGKWCAFAVVFLSLYMFFIGNAQGQLEDEYDMGAAYRLLVCTLITINYAFSSKKIFPIVASLMGVFYTISMGTRGPLAVVIFFTAVCYLYHMKGSTIKKIVIVGLIALAAGLVMNDAIYYAFMSFLSNILSSLHVSTRIVDMMLQGELAFNEDRQVIYDFLWDKLSEQPLTGYGAYAEWTFQIQGAHRVYIEILFEYGYILGGLILLLYGITLIKTYVSIKNVYQMEWFLIWSCYVLLRGIWGERFISFQVFFLLGFCLNMIRENNKHNTLIKTSNNLQTNIV